MQTFAGFPHYLVSIPSLEAPSDENPIVRPVRCCPFRFRLIGKFRPSLRGRRDHDDE